MRAVAPLLALLLAATAAAQSTPFQREAIAMMPGLSQPQRNKLTRLHAAATKETAAIAKRLGQIDAALEAKPRAPETGKLREERGKLQARLPQIFTRLEQRALAAGLDATQLARLEAMPRGKLREQRYNHSVVLEAPDLSAAQRTLLLRVVATTDAAQAAALAQQEFLSKGLDAVDATLRRRIDVTCRRQRREIERRFWRAAHYALTPKQMRAARELFSPRYRGIPELRRQLYLLPGLSPTQAARITARFTECESESAADLAEVRRIRVRRKDKSLRKEERGQLDRRNAECYARIRKLNEARRAAVRATLTPMQRDALDALPPVLNINDRSRAPWEALRAMRLRPAQAARVKELQRRSGRARREIQRARRNQERGLLAAGLGSESPQRMTMEMARKGAQGRNIALHREMGRTLFVDILDPGQVAGWVVAPSLSP